MNIVSFIRQKRIKWLKWRIKRNRVWFNYAMDTYNRINIEGCWDDSTLQLIEWRMNCYENKILLYKAKIVYLTEKERSERNGKE